MRWLAALALLAAGCGATQRAPVRWQGAPQVWDGATGVALAPAAWRDRLAAARIVAVGEHHGSPLSHTTQLQVAQALRRQGRPVTLAVEWFPPSSQPVLDAWVAGTLDEAALRAHWRKHWGHRFAAYAPLLRWARAQRVPLRAINAEPGLSRAVARGTEASLPPAKRALLPPLDSGHAAHEAWFNETMQAAMRAHGGQAMSAAKLRRYYRAQLVWDETMARGVARWHRAAPAGAALVVCAGEGHVAWGFGVPERARAATGAEVLTVIGSAEVPAKPTARQAGRPPADLLWRPGRPQRR